MRLTRIKLDGTAETKKKLAELGDVLARKALAETAEDVEEYVAHEAGKHSRDGALFRSVFNRPEGRGFAIGHDTSIAPHALFVHWGTRPHVIKPKKKKSLRWASGGAFFFSKLVRHPGYKGDPWLIRAARHAPTMFALHVQKHLDNKA